MAVPTECTVLVIGGGPGGSYAAAALAREGFSTVLLEAEVFPRYHVGESMVPSIRHFLRFIDLDTTFNDHGFVKKVSIISITGAAFKLNNQRDAYTDFILASGPDSYAWNVIRSESDDLMFRHAGKNGANIFDGTKVTAIEFAPPLDHGAIDTKNSDSDAPTKQGRPVSATWSRKDGSSGEVKFDYLVDASGRTGLVSTKYLKNRTFNQDLKNVASWGYWKGAIQYGVGSPKEGQPFFEALRDGSGWAWFIPLHNKTTSVGIVMNQALSSSKKKTTASPSSLEFYRASIQEARGVARLLSKAELTTDVKHASDWSYSASSYASPYVRIVGDAGAFIDPYFSSGIHLALSGALSAAVTICASIRGDCEERVAWKWHSQGVAERFTRFLLVVLGATKQIRSKDAPVLNTEGDDGFDDAFSIIRPVIQGIADVDGRISKEEVYKAVDFTYNAVNQNKQPEERKAVVQELQNSDDQAEGAKGTHSTTWKAVANEVLEDEERKFMKLAKNVFTAFFTVDAFDGMVVNLKHGSLGLVKSETVETETGEKVGDKGPKVELDAKQPMVEHRFVDVAVPTSV
ncbi:MAG: hypothetical protein Q9195_002151 [Heterodermia aff. obscurata]